MTSIFAIKKKMLVKMQSKQIENRTLLFPNYFKKVGVIVIIAIPIILITIKTFNKAFFHLHNDLIQTTAANAFIIGLSFIVMAKDKVEDERTAIIRLNAMASAFLAVICYVIIVPYMNILIRDSSQESIYRLVVYMLFVYLFAYYSIKKVM